MARTKKVKYLTNEQGVKEAVLVSIAEYRQLREAVEELAAIEAYDKAKASKDEAISFAQALAELERSAG